MKKVRNSSRLAHPHLSREKIVKAALQLANKNGLSALSMRKVAQSLGVEAMSLYKHVENKDDLLDGVIELIVSQMSLPSLDIGWKNALRERAISERKVLKEHSWVVNLFESRSGTGVVRLTHQNHIIGILRQSGFSVELAFKAMIALTGYIYGFVILESAWSSAPKERAKVVKKAKVMITPADYPYVFEVASYGISTKNSVDFEFGLNLILDGFEKNL